MANCKPKKNEPKKACEKASAKSIREIALSLLNKIEAAGQYSNIALDITLRKNNLQGEKGGADRALLTTLVYGVLEKKITLDYCINSLSAIPPSKIEKDTRNALRMGLYQLCFLDHIPDHAVINETVKLCRTRAKGFVNALLRKVVRENKSLPLPSKEDSLPLYLSVKFSFPEKLCEKFLDIFGAHRTESLLFSFNTSKQMTIRTNTLKISRDALLSLLSENGIEAEKTEFSDTGIKIISKVALPSIVGEKEGLWFVQDEASQLCAMALGAKEGDVLIDACSCPGGKSFSSALHMNNKGTVYSFDIHANKLSLVETGAARLGISCIKTKKQDGKELYSELYEKADCVLCDVPCSGFGVFAKKPDIRYKNLSDIKRLPSLQLDILENCSHYVKDGGTLVYSTCTILPEENENNVKAFLAQNKNFISDEFSFGSLYSENGMLTLYPDIHGTDGFFIAKFKKVKEEI